MPIYIQAFKTNNLRKWICDQHQYCMTCPLIKYLETTECHEEFEKIKDEIMKELNIVEVEE